MTSHSHAFVDSQLDHGNRSEESQAAVAGVAMMRSLPEVTEENTTFAQEPSELHQFSLSTQSQTCPGSTKQGAARQASPAKSAQASSYATNTSADPSSSGLVANQLVPGAGNHRSSTTSATKKQNSTTLTELALQSSPPTPSNATSGASEDPKWGVIHRNELVETQAYVGTRVTSDKEDVEEADAEESSPVTSTPRKAITASQAPAPLPSSSASQAPPSTSASNMDTPPRKSIASFNVTGVTSAGAVMPVAKPEIVSPERFSAYPLSPQTGKTPQSVNRKQAPVHIGGLKRGASSALLRSNSKRKSSKDDFDNFGTSDEDSSSGHQRRAKQGKKQAAIKRTGRASSGGENRAVYNDVPSLEMDLDNSASQDSIPPARSHLQVPSRHATSSGTNLGSQDMSLQCGTAPSVVLSSRPSGHAGMEVDNEEDDQSESLPRAVGLTKAQQQQQGGVSAVDPKIIDELDGDDTEVIPPTSDAENMAIDSSEPDRDISAANFSRASAQHATPPTDPVEAPSASPSVDSGFKYATTASPRFGRTAQSGQSNEGSSHRSSISNGRGIEPQAGRELTRSRQNTSMFDLPPLELDTQSSLAKTQPVETETLVASKSTHARFEATSARDAASSPSAEHTRYIPDSQYPRGARAAEDDRTIGSSEADALLGEEQAREGEGHVPMENEDAAPMQVDDEGPRDDLKEGALSEAESELPDISTASRSTVKKPKQKAVKAKTSDNNGRKKSKRKSIEMAQSDNDAIVPPLSKSTKSKKAKIVQPVQESEDEMEEEESEPVLVMRASSAKVASDKKSKGKERAAQQPPAGKELTLAKQAMETSRKEKTTQKRPVSATSTSTATSTTSKGRKSRATSTGSDISRTSSRKAFTSRVKTAVYHDSEDEDEESRPTDSTTTGSISVKGKERAGHKATLPIERVYVRIDDYCYPGTLSLSEQGKTPFRVDFDDGSWLDLHLEDLAKRVYRCEVLQGDVVISSPDMNGVRPGAPRYRVLGVDMEKRSRVKGGLAKEDLVIVQQCNTKGKVAESSEKWLVKATALAVKSCDLKSRVLSIKEMQAFTNLVAEEVQDMEEQVDVEPVKTQIKTKLKPVVLASSNIPKHLFRDFGLIFTTGDGAADAIAIAKSYALAGGATDISDVSELFTTLDPEAESQTDTTLSFDSDSQQAGLDNILLIAVNPVTTPKYLKALAIGIPCVSHRWVLDCIEKGEIVDWRTCTLGAGTCAIAGSHVNGLQALILNQGSYSLASIAARQHLLHIFAGKRVVFLHGTRDDISTKRAEMATDLMTALGASKVLVSPINAPPSREESKKYDLFLSDTKTGEVKNLSKKIKVRSWEWLKRCVVSGRILDNQS